MKTMVHSVVINRPIEDVWNYFVEWDNIPKWYPGVREIKPLTEGRLGLGSSFRMSTGIGPVKLGAVIRVVEFESGRLVVFQIGTKVKTSFIFERVGGGTRFTKSQDREWFLRPFDGISNRLRNRFFAKLKLLMEAPP